MQNTLNAGVLFCYVPRECPNKDTEMIQNNWVCGCVLSKRPTTVYACAWNSVKRPDNSSKHVVLRVQCNNPESSTFKEK